MKNKFLILLLCLVLLSCSKEEPAPEPIVRKEYEGDINLYSQADVEAFAKEKYTIVNGILWIESLNAPVTSLKSLWRLHEVSTLRIIKTNLQNFEGLENLITVHSDFGIGGNTALTSLAGLDSLVSVGNHLAIGDNPKLIDLTGFETLEEVNTFQIMHNNGLESLEGLRRLRVVYYYGGVYNNPNLTDLCGIKPVIQSMEFPLDVSNNAYNPTREDIEAGNCKP